MSKVKLGIIGVGNMGTGHLNNIMDGHCPEIEIVAIADRKQERIDAAKEKLGDLDVKTFSEGSDLINSGVAQAVLIAVPHYDHPTLAIEAFKAGLHVMCEKPAGVYTKQVRLMNEEAKKHDVVFGMMFNQRTNHIYRKMREIVKSGRLGEIRRTSWIITNWYRTQYYYDSGAWRATWSGEGGGVLLNQCPHNLDLWQWICGMPTLVDAKLHYGKWHDIEVEDDVTCYVEYENGATGTFITTTGEYCGDNRFEINLDKGKLIAEDGKLFMWEGEVSEQEYNASQKVTFSKPEEIMTFSEVETDGENPQHVGVLNSFAGAILRGEPLIAGGEEGINGLTLSNAMHLSSWLSKPIELPIDEDVYYEELMKRVETSRAKTNVNEVVGSTAGSYNS